MPAKHRITINVTSEFDEFLREFAKDELSLGEALIELATPAARDAGYKGNLMVGRGEYKRQRDLDKLIERVDAMTDYGANDPTEN